MSLIFVFIFIVFSNKSLILLDRCGSEYDSCGKYEMWVVLHIIVLFKIAAQSSVLKHLKMSACILLAKQKSSHD